MPKYEALILLWSPSQERYIEPGETFDIADDKADVARLLMDLGQIKPAAKPTKQPAAEMPQAMRQSTAESEE